jgi:hypothetical protein
VKKEEGTLFSGRFGNGIVEFLSNMIFGGLEGFFGSTFMSGLF